MTATTDTRKRSREDESCDSMPLSKRINNLHINNSLQDFAGAHESLGHNSNNLQPHQMNNTYKRANEGHTGSCEENGFVARLDASSQESLHGYNPELDQHENPYYYNKNKLLYELHLERVQRTHHP